MMKKIIAQRLSISSLNADLYKMVFVYVQLHFMFRKHINQHYTSKMGKGVDVFLLVIALFFFFFFCVFIFLFRWLVSEWR